jgi:hypothetical protein
MSNPFRTLEDIESHLIFDLSARTTADHTASPKTSALRSPRNGAEKKSRKSSQNLPIPHPVAFCCTGKRPLAGDLRVGLRFWSFFLV